MSLEKENKELRKLVNINKDACSFYNTACSEAESPLLKQTFRDLESLHNDVVINIQRHIYRNGGDPEAKETLAGQASRFWTEMVAKIGNDVDETLVKHLEEAEDRCLHSLEKALQDNDIRPATKTLLQDELDALQKSHDHMKSLKDRAIAA